MESLFDIAKKHGTDKLDHGYISHYYDVFDGGGEPYSLLEIGVLHGASMRMWREYYPNTELWGLDLFVETNPPTDVNANWIKGSQIDPEILYNIRHNVCPEIIIDDGSHNSIDQLVTFFSLAGSCKTYIVEDLHCCMEDFYRQGLPFSATMLGMMKTRRFPFEFNLYDNKIAFIKTK